MSDNDGEFGAFFSGFFIGGLIGAVTALLLAPQSGEETRKQISDKGIELRDRADDELKKLREQADATLQDVRKQSEELQRKAAESLTEASTRIKSAVESMQKGEGKIDAELPAE
jgi:gas vesicle protein